MSDAGLSVDLVTPAALGGAERAAWDGFVAASPQLRSPYFSLAYVLATDGVVPGAQVAVIHRQGSLLGFLPVQRRRGLLQPLAAPLTDYHGLIASPDTALEVEDVLRAVGAGAFRFTGLRDGRPLRHGGAIARMSMTADVSGGMDRYLATHPRAARFLKEKARTGRNFEREHGPLEFRYTDADPDLFDFVIARKREQYRRTGRHDIFACGWTERLLRRLWDERTPAFGARFCSLRARGRLAAAELRLVGQGVHHIWFPAYDPALARFGPGVQMMHHLLRAAADDPAVETIDFGLEGEAYKAIYADPTHATFQGHILAPGLRRTLSRAADATLAGTPGARRVSALRERVRRRLDVIDACETTPGGWLGGVVDALGGRARRRASPAT